jgi:hypothetical protein
MDNSTAVCYVNWGRGTRSKSLIFSRRPDFIVVWDSSSYESCRVFARPPQRDHRQRIKNETRQHWLGAKWSSLLNPERPLEVPSGSVFCGLELQPSQILRLDATTGSNRSGRFLSEMQRTECLRLPPFRLLPRSLAKIRRERATVFLVRPYWPSARWYSLLLDLAVDVAKVLRPNKKLLKSPQDGVAHTLLLYWSCGSYPVTISRPRLFEGSVELLLGYQLNLTQLSKKLATLLALATFLRVSELSSILRQLVRFSNSGVSFSLGRPRKAQNGGALRTIVVDKLSDPLIRPVQCLGSYIYLTDVKRNEKNGFFLL